MKMAQFNINLPTVSKMNVWKELDANSFKILSEDAVKEAAEECEYLCEPLSMAFGPNGLGVMMPDITGLTISRIASQLLNIFDRGCSPVRDTLLKSAINLESITGDGLKTYFILLTSFFKNIVNCDRALIYNQLKKLLYAIQSLPDLQSERTADLDDVISTFFSTRFTLPVAKLLFCLFKKWITLNEPVDKDIFTFLLNNFDALLYHKHNSFPLDESKLTKGVTLSGHFIGEFPKDREEIILKVLYYPDDNKDDKMDVDVHIKIFLNEVMDLKEKIFLVVNNEVPARGRHLLREKGINLLMHAEPITTKLLRDFTLTYRHKHKSDPVIGYSCDILSHMTNITLEIPVYQIHIYAPSKTYMKSYSISLRDCLRLCRYISDTKSFIIPAGQFDRMFALYFCSQFDNENDTLPVKDHKELLKWHENKCSLSEKLKQLNFKKNPENLEEIVVNIMLHLKSCNLTLDNEVVRIVCEALMDVARRLPESNIEHSSEPLSLKLEILQRALITLLMVVNIDKVIKCKKINTSLDENDLLGLSY